MVKAAAPGRTDIDALLAVNIRGPVLATQAAIPHLGAGGRVITIGSAGADRIVGVDINPFAIAIARFRLAVAALQRAGETSLETATPRHVRVLTGDSLLHGRQRPGTGESFDAVDLQLGGFFASPEEIDELREALRSGSYDAVVGNPPYITVKDKALNQLYRRLYPTTTKGGYALSAPFLERFFDLARPESATTPAGRAGQITANSFMKREFGKKLIEDCIRSSLETYFRDLRGAERAAGQAEAEPRCAGGGRSGAGAGGGAPSCGAG